MKDVVFIGNRLHVYNILTNRSSGYRIIKLFVLQDSPLHIELKHLDIPYELFTKNKQSKLTIVQQLKHVKFDLLISNGCPFILPIADLSKANPSALFINTHPSYLPDLKGNTPLNGVFYLGYKYIGATTHYMDEGVDTGNIIYQQKIDLTPDIDQGLVYYLSFKMEGEVFEKALNILEQNNFAYKGQIQAGGGSTFNRQDELFAINFETDSDEEIIKKVRSVGINIQGIKLPDTGYIVFEAEKIINLFLLSLFGNASSGKILLVYSNKILLKTKEGIIKFSYAAK